MTPQLMLLKGFLRVEVHVTARTFNGVRLVRFKVPFQGFFGAVYFVTGITVVN